MRQKSSAGVRTQVCPGGRKKAWEGGGAGGPTVGKVIGGRARGGGKMGGGGNEGGEIVRKNRGWGGERRRACKGGWAAIGRGVGSWKVKLMTRGGGEIRGGSRGEEGIGNQAVGECLSGGEVS